MNADAKLEDNLFKIAEAHLARIKEFAVNPADVKEYLLRRANAEYKQLQESGFQIDFNTLYKTVYTEFVMHSYNLIIDRLHNSPSSRCVFDEPSEEQTLEQIVDNKPMEEVVKGCWNFICDTPERYVSSISDIAKKIPKSKNWGKHVYVSEIIFRKYTGEPDDGVKYHKEKRIIEQNFRSYDACDVLISVEKNFPRGPFKAHINLFVKGVKTASKIEQVRLNSESSIDEYVEQKKKKLDEIYSPQANNGQKTNE